MNTSQEITRVRRSKKSARVTYNRLSCFYDLLAGPSERRFTLLGLEMLDARPGENILEIGPGTGHSLVTLGKAVTAAGLVIGVDISEGMLGKTRKRLIQSGLEKKAAIGVGDATHLPLKNNALDAIFASFTLELFDTPEIPSVLAECKRVLRKNGRIGVVTLARTGGRAVRIYEWVHDRFPNYVDCRPIYARKNIEEAGFRVTGLREKSMWGFPVEIVTARKS